MELLFSDDKRADDISGHCGQKKKKCRHRPQRKKAMEADGSEFVSGSC